MQQFSDPHVFLDWAREIGRSYPFLDFHVHPFDVLTGDTEYQLDEQVEGLYHKGSAISHSSQVTTSAVSPVAHSSRPITLNSLLLASRLAYSHTGPRILIDQLDAAGLAGALLLPVVRVPGAAESLLEVSANMFAKNRRLYSSSAFPIGVPPGELAHFFRSARAKWGIRAIKLHPNLAEVDPLTKPGRDLIEAMLAAAGSMDLPVVIHGGRTPALEPAACREYGTLAHLSNVDWSISSAPVIIAHCGLYCLSEEEAFSALDDLKRLFERYPNLMADTSNLEPPILQLVLEKVDPGRLIFGSDALYVPIWKSWVRFLQTLRLVSRHPDDDLIQIASLNPGFCLRSQLVENKANPGI